MNKSHPLDGVDLKIANFKCFGDKHTGFELFQPINLIIGRNNVGKSGLIDAIELCIKRGSNFDARRHGRTNHPFEVVLTQTLDHNTIKDVFLENTSGGGIPGNHWDYGKQFIGRRYSRAFGPGWKSKEFGVSVFAGIGHQPIINRILETAPYPFGDMELLRVEAERDVRPEARDSARTVTPNGAGTTNLVRSFINSDDLPREEVEIGLLNDLNIVYKGDCRFTAVVCREDSSQIWEVFIREEGKGDIRLSQSGSSLKSIFIILAMLRLIPITRTIIWERVVFSVEEPENNLHPALLRRLLNFLAEKRDELGFTLLIATHSPIGIDWATQRNDSQVLHVQHDGQCATVRTAIGYAHNSEILDDLDIRASDILQANGVIWVEGPSDRIYLKRWIELASDGELLEGVHYTIMFYGGKVLSHFDGLPPEERGELVSLMSINRNAALLMDSDRKLGSSHRGDTKARRQKPRMNINATKARIKTELERLGGFVWVTEGREIENYTPAAVFARVCATPEPNIGMYQQVAELPFLSSFKQNKVAIAHAVVQQTFAADLKNFMDVWTKLEELCDKIRKWNAIFD